MLYSASTTYELQVWSRSLTETFAACRCTGRRSRDEAQLWRRWLCGHVFANWGIIHAYGPKWVNLYQTHAEPSPVPLLSNRSFAIAHRMPTYSICAVRWFIFYMFSLICQVQIHSSGPFDIVWTHRWASSSLQR